MNSLTPVVVQAIGMAWRRAELAYGSQKNAAENLTVIHNVKVLAYETRIVKASRGFEPRSLDSESRVLTVTP